MKPQPDPARLLQKEFLAQLPSLWPPLKGSLAFVKKPCIRKNCPACARGDKHPAWIFSFTQDGRRRCIRSQRPGPTLASGTPKRTPPGTTPLCPRPGFASRPPSRTTQTGLSLHRLHYCRDCLGKQQEIDRLKEENARLKDRLRYQERNAREAPFGSSTPFGQTGRQAQHPGGQPKEKRRGQTGPCWQWPPPAPARGNHPHPARARTPGVSGMWRWPPGQRF